MQDTDVIQHITDLCIERGWTYYKLAKESGIPYSTINNMIHRTNIPSIPTLQKICNGFGISLADFFSDGSCGAQLNEQQKELLSLYNDLTLEDKRLATAYIYGLLRKKIG